MKHYRAINRAITLLFIEAFFFRLIALDQSLWLDEATTAQTLKRFGFFEIINTFSPADFHPPLYYLFMKLWTSLFGYSEVALRAPSVLFSLAAGWLVYLIAKKFKDEQTGLFASLFFLFNPLIFYYSQEARMYMMATFFLSVCLYSMLSLVSTSSHAKESSQESFIFLFNIFALLSMFTFYGSIFLIASLYVYLLYKRKTNLLLVLLPGTVFALVILSPLLYQQYVHARETLILVPNWHQVLGNANPKNLFLIPLKFSVGRIQWEPKWKYYLTGGTWVLMVFFYSIKGGLRHKRLLFLFSFPILLGLLFSFFTPLLQYFRFLYLLPILAVLLALGINSTYKRATILLCFMVFSCIYLFSGYFHREDWKNLARSIPQGKSVYMIYSSSDPLQYYLEKDNRKDVQIKDLRMLEVYGPKELYIIPYTSDIHGVNYKNKLSLFLFELKKIYTFRGVQMEMWGK